MTSIKYISYRDPEIKETKPDLKTSDFQFQSVIQTRDVGDVIKIRKGNNLYIAKKVRNDHYSLEVININNLYIIGNNRRNDYIRFCESMNLLPDENYIDEWVRIMAKTTTIGHVRLTINNEENVYVVYEYIQTRKHKCKDFVNKVLYYCELLKAHRIAHSDVSLRNWIVTESGPVLIDFGAACYFDELNMNPLPVDVTPQVYNLDDRSTTLTTHDLKGFYISLCDLLKGGTKDLNFIRDLDNDDVTHTQFYNKCIREFPSIDVPIPNPDVENKSPVSEPLSSPRGFTHILIDHMTDMNSPQSIYQDTNFVIQNGLVPRLKEQIKAHFMNERMCNHLCGICCCLCCIGMPCCCSYIKGMLEADQGLSAPMLSQKTILWLKDIYDSDRIQIPGFR